MLIIIIYTFSVDQGNLILLYFNSLFFNWLFLLLAKLPNAIFVPEASEGMVMNWGKPLVLFSL